MHEIIQLETKWTSDCLPLQRCTYCLCILQWITASSVSNYIRDLHRRLSTCLAPIFINFKSCPTSYLEKTPASRTRLGRTNRTHLVGFSALLLKGEFPILNGTDDHRLAPTRPLWSDHRRPSCSGIRCPLRTDILIEQRFRISQLLRGRSFKNLLFGLQASSFWHVRN